MFKQINVKFSQSEIDLLRKKLSMLKKSQVKYPYRTQLLMISLLFILVFFVYFAENNDSRIFLFISVVSTVFPVWVIILSIINYIRKGIPKKRQINQYKKCLSKGDYEGMLIEASKYDVYSEKNIDYYIFHIDRNRLLLFRLQDFEYSEKLFPNNKFIIPLCKYYEIIGNKIITEGELIKTINFNSDLILKYKENFGLIEPGQIMELNNN